MSRHMHKKHFIPVTILILCYSLRILYAQDGTECSGSGSTILLNDISRRNYLLFSSDSVNLEFYIWDVQNQTVAVNLPFSEFDLQTEQLGLPEAETFRIPRIAPDGSHVSYAQSYSSDDLSRSIQLVWSIEENRLISTFVWHTNWLHFIDWIDENQLAFLSHDEELAIEVVDLQGLVRQRFSLSELEIAIPNAPFSGRSYDSLFFLWTALSRRLNMVLFLRTSEPDSRTFRVFNVQSQEEFYHLDSGTAFNLAPGVHQRNPGIVRPIWSPRGDQLALVLPSATSAVMNLFILSDQGVLRQLTFFQLGDDIESTRVANPAWSPDSSLIAFWLLTSANGIANPRKLYIYNLEHNSAIDTGISFLGEPNIVWSPTGDYLAYSDQYENELVIVDVNNCGMHLQNIDFYDESNLNQVYEWFEMKE